MRKIKKKPVIRIVVRVVISGNSLRQLYFLGPTESQRESYENSKPRILPTKLKKIRSKIVYIDQKLAAQY